MRMYNWQAGSQHLSNSKYRQHKTRVTESDYVAIAE